jgi:hypothetical protein
MCQLQLSGIAGITIRTTPCTQTNRSLSNRILSSWFPFWYNYNIFSNSHFFSGQSRHASSPSIMLYLWLGARRPMSQSYDSSGVSRYYLGWPLRLLRGNSAYENLPCEAQRPKCCLYKTPYYVAALIRETGDVIVRTPLYVQLPTYAPTRTRFFFVHE